MARRALVILLMILVLLSASVHGAAAATQQEIETAVNDGLVWLVHQQDSTSGAWSLDYYPVGATGLALLELETHATLRGLSPFQTAYEYHENVTRGLGYLFANAHTIKIGMQTHGNPDSDGNGIGIYFNSTASGSRDYESSIALMAIVSTNAPDRIATVESKDWTYRQIAANIIDFLAYAQADGGQGEGGWTYDECDNCTWAVSDNSNSGFVSMGFHFAEIPTTTGGFGLTVPAFVKQELGHWIGYIQNMTGGPNDGGSGYNGPNDWVNTLKTGHLLQELSLVGELGSSDRVQRAVAYLVRHWNDLNLGLERTEAGWKGKAWPPSSSTPSDYLATFTMMQGLTSQGLVKIDGTAWYDDFAYAIVTQQQEDGSWLPVSGQGETIPAVLTSEWALLTLDRVTPNGPALPQPTIPEYPLGIPLLAIFMLIAYSLIKRQTSERNSERLLTA